MDKFTTIKASDLLKEVDKDWRFVQLHGVKTDSGVDVIYSFMENDNIINLKVENATELPSITEKFLAAFVFENETHDLFGVKFDNIAIDFEGKFYNIAQDQPMTIVSPEVIKRKERVRKLKEAKKNG